MRRAIRRRCRRSRRACARAPNALYALVQTVLVQDEALKRADAAHPGAGRAAAAAEQSQASGGFLDSMRDAIFGRTSRRRSARCPTCARPRSPAAAGRPGIPVRCCSRRQGRGGAYNQPAYAQPAAAAAAPRSGGGGSFLGTAAAAAAGVVGGSLLIGSIRCMMGGGSTSRRSATPAVIAAASRIAVRGATSSPAAIWRARPASTTSARQPARDNSGNDDSVHARDSSITARTRTTSMTMTTTRITTASTAMTATAITPERVRDR